MENGGLEILLGLRKIIKESRKLKAESQEEGIQLRGANSESVKLYQARAEKMAEKISGAYGEWVNSHYESLKNLLGDVSKEDLYAAFLQGLKLSLKQEYIFLESRKQLKGDEVLQQDRNIKKAIVTFGLEFIQLLKKSLQAGAPPRTAVDLASLAYIYRPDVLMRYKEKYPQYNITVLLRALIKHRSDPDSYLQRIDTGIDELLPRYTQFGRSAVKHVVSNYTPQEAEKFLREASAKLPIYLQRYPNLPEGLVKHAIITNPKRIDEFLSNPEGFPKEYSSHKKKIVGGIVGENVNENE